MSSKARQARETIADTPASDGRYVPDYNNTCEVCGESPTVVFVRAGKVESTTGMCGPCTWEEDAMHNPANWNP
jgi:hypothetical protein